MSEKIDLTLFVPGLSHLASLQPPMPVLQRLLSRADKGRAAKGGLERELFALFNQLVPANSELPVAAITYELDTGEPADGAILRADPIYCQAGRDQVILMAASLDLSMDEAQQMVADLNRLFAEDGWQFIAATPQRWYLRMPNAEKLKATSISQVMGRDIHKLLPSSEADSTLHRSLSEIEMLLHSNFANQQRLNNRQAPVTNLWLWGGGSLPTKPVSDYAQVWSSDALALGLAKQAGVPRCDIPTDGTTWLEQAVTAGKHLVTLTSVEDPIWFEEHWVVPIAEALTSGKLNSIQLQPGNGRYYQISRRSQRRWWRRSQSLSSLL